MTGRSIKTAVLAGMFLFHAAGSAASLAMPQGILLTLPGREIPELAAPVFSNQQMKKGAPNLKWEKVSESETEERVVLAGKDAGLDLDGVVLTRSIRRDDRMVTIRFTLENRTGEMRYSFFGFRSRFRIGKTGVDRNYVPTENNVLDLDYQTSLWGYYTKPGEWFFDLVEPWYAVLNGNRTGVAYLTDQQVVSAAYLSNDMLTRGMMIDGGMLPPGKKFSTEIRILPLKNLNSVATVTEKFSAGFGKEGKVVLELLPYRDEVYSGEVTLRDVKGKELGRKKVRFEGKAMRLSSCAVEREKPTTQTVNYGKINGISFEQYQENGFRTQPLPMVPPLFTHKRIIPPKKAVAYSSYGVIVPRKKKALLLFGFYADFYRFDKILADWELEMISATPQGITQIPPVSTIDEYRFIILGDVNWESVRPMITRLISYVRNGGILIVCGGPFAYGCGGYKDTPLEKILPVEPYPFDLRPAAGEGVFDQGISFDQPENQPPQIWWIHKNKCKADSEILVKAGSDPLIVKGTYGKGTVIAFLGSPLGDPKKEDRPFWNSAEYIKLMKQILGTAAGKELK
jgi:hypothetical protein